MRPSRATSCAAPFDAVRRSNSFASRMDDKTHERSPRLAESPFIRPGQPAASADSTPAAQRIYGVPLLREPSPFAQGVRSWPRTPTNGTTCRAPAQAYHTAGKAQQSPEGAFKTVGASCVVSTPVLRAAERNRNLRRHAEGVARALPAPCGRVRRCRICGEDYRASFLSSR